MARRYSIDTRDRAIRMILEYRAAHPSWASVIRYVSGALGVHTGTLKSWYRRAEALAGVKPSQDCYARVTLLRLQRQASDLELAVEIVASINELRARDFC